MFLPFALLMATVLNPDQTAPEPTSSPSPTPEQHQRIRGLRTLTTAFKALNPAETEDDELITQIFDQNSPQQQKITAFQPMPAVPHTIKELQYASGNWFGPRDFLHEHGLDFSTVYTGLFIGNPVGGKSQGFAYADSIALSLLIETEKLFGWKGGHIVMSAVQQDGGSKENLSTAYIGNQFTVNGIVGGTTIKWANLYWNQTLFDDHFDIIFGRCAAMDEFDNSPVLWNYVGSLQANPTNLKTTWSPNTSWGGRVKLRLTHDSDIRYGLYQITTPGVNNLCWNFFPSDSTSMFAQYTWNPEFCKPGSTTIFDALKKEEPKNTAADHSDDKSFKNPVDLAQLKKLPGHYFIGGSYTSEGVAQFTNGTSQANACAFYIHGDQMVYRPNQMTDAGLILWTEWGYSPESENAFLTLQAKGGAIYQGLIPGRINDFTIFGWGYGLFNPNYANFQKSQGKGGDSTYEIVNELGYRINFTRFFYIQPDLQYIINPGGTVGAISNALVLGAQVGITF